MSWGDLRVIRGPGLRGRSISEHVLQADLNDAISAAAIDFAGSGIRKTAIAYVGDGCLRAAQVEVVERIKRVGPELNSLTLCNGEVLLNTDVPVPEARSKQHVARRV